MNTRKERRGIFSTDVFALRYRENALVYAPLLGVIARSNFAGVNLLRRLNRTPDNVLKPQESEFLAQLAELGLTRSAEGIKLSRPDETPFTPRCVSLYLTNACNLRCVYCYASAGDALKPTVLDFEAGAAGIRYVADLVKQAEEDAFAVSFHGAGEPTLAWDSLVRLTDYARQVGKQKNLRVSITTCTNGVMSAEHARWLALHTDGATISLDGDAASQNSTRPFRSGAASYNHVARSLHILKEEGFYHSIRATITDENVRQMTEMVDMMADRFTASHLQFDPVLVSGRCLETGCGAVDPDTFAVEFMGAYDRALQRGVELGFSILSINSQRNYYCCAVSDGFTITHDGLITSCFDVYRPDHPFAECFIYGSYNRKTKQIDINRQTLARLRCRNTCRMSSCQNCFCKYMCCGDCTVNAMRQGLNLMKGGGRCRITQAIGAFMLARKTAVTGERVPYCVVADERNDFCLSNTAWAESW